MPLRKLNGSIQEPVIETFSLPNFTFIQTSSPTINAELGGGFVRGTVNGLYGLFGAGKSQWCEDVAVNVALAHGSIALIDSDAACGHAPQAKLNMIQRLGGSVLSGDELRAKGILTGTDPVELSRQYYAYLDSVLVGLGVVIYAPMSMEALHETIAQVTTETVYDLLVVDSLTLYYKDDVCANRGQSNKEYGGQYLPVVAQIMLLLDAYAKTGSTVIVTCQRISEIGMEKQAKLHKNEEYREYVGSDIPGYHFKTIIELKKKNNTFAAFIHKNRGSPADPRRGIPFAAIPGGIA
jgi:RecA/RadA recombinase